MPTLGRISYKNYSLLVIIPIFVIAVAMSVLEAYFGTLYGDLTRIGQLDENDFGWRMQQPNISGHLLISSPLNEADILVIGDSFSNGLIWQSQLINAGYKPATLKWEDFKPCGMGENLGEVIRSAGFKGRYVIIESIEHGFQNRMDSHCEITNKMRSTSYQQPLPATMPPDASLSLSKPPLGGDWVFNALINKIKFTYLFDDAKKYLDFGNSGARVVPVNNGCALFSNKKCNFGLFYSHDFDKKTFTSINNILTINSNLKKNGLESMWLVVPDKATVYLGYGKFNENFFVNPWDIMAQHTELRAPNLAELFTQQSHIIRDFYKPNDVHLSTNGYLYMGSLVTGLLKNQ
ncbi:MAG: hypothetical protein WCK93_05925 [Nitrosomonadales bacterium]